MPFIPLPSIEKETKEEKEKAREEEKKEKEEKIPLLKKVFFGAGIVTGGVAGFTVMPIMKGMGVMGGIALGGVAGAKTYDILKGWRKESVRHSLAAKGIKTGRKKKSKSKWNGLGKALKQFRGKKK